MARHSFEANKELREDSLDSSYMTSHRNMVAYFTSTISAYIAHKPQPTNLCHRRDLTSSFPKLPANNNSWVIPIVLNNHKYQHPEIQNTSFA
jgi:hypothetical protein